MRRRTVVAITHGLGLGLCMASVMNAGAQQPGPEPHSHDALRPAERQPYACVDPADPTARPRLLREPCRLPMYRLPVAEAPGSSDSPPRSTALPVLPEREGHAMFWRLPVQPRGRYDAPRNSWR
jgi:hypothetical protein